MVTYNRNKDLEHYIELVHKELKVCYKLDELNDQLGTEELFNDTNMIFTINK